QGEIVPEPEPLPGCEVLHEEFGSEAERRSHVEPDPGVPVLDENLVPADLGDPSVAGDLRHAHPLPAPTAGLSAVARSPSQSRPSPPASSGSRASVGPGRPS